MTKSQQRRAYNAYLADWKATYADQVEPECIQWDVNAVNALKVGATNLKRADAKLVNRLAGIYQLADGRLAEVGWTNSGNLPLAYVWPSVSAWTRYSRPMTFNQYHEFW
jgi:hypothetical protein